MWKFRYDEDIIEVWNMWSTDKEYQKEGLFINGQLQEASGETTSRGEILYKGQLGNGEKVEACITETFLGFGQPKCSLYIDGELVAEERGKIILREDDEIILKRGKRHLSRWETRWTYRYGNDVIVVENLLSGEQLCVNDEVQDKKTSFKFRSELKGKLPSGEEIKVALGGGLTAKCTLFVDNKLQTPECQD